MKWVLFGYDNSYRVNKNAVIQSCLSVGRSAKKTSEWVNKKQCLKASDKHGGKYLAVGIKLGPSCYKSQYVHRIVATAFILNPGNLPEVDHIDGDRTNNNYKNLRWVTRKQNAQNAANRGALNHHKVSVFADSKEDLDKLRDVYKRLKKGETNSSVARDYGVNQSTISNFLNGKIYRFFYEKTELPLLPPRKSFSKRWTKGSSGALLVRNTL